MAESVTLDALYVGVIREAWPGKPPSAISKQAVDRVLSINVEGFTDDAQADRRVHGGPQKAIHHYAGEHYAIWREELGRDDLAPGSFGENVSTHGMTEHTVAIGDVFRLGSALVQVSQGRQPCWKLNAHTGEEDMAARFQSTGRTGWYYRVLEAGSVGPGDTMTLIERPTPQWSVYDVTHARLLKRASGKDNAALAALETLSPEWRAWFAQMAETRSAT